MKKEITAEEIVDILANTGTKAWNEAIASRLESMKSYLSQDEWQKGVGVHLKAMQGEAIKKLLGSGLPAEGYNYLRGFIAGLRFAASLPESVDAAIAGEELKQKSGPKGDAGY